MRWRIQARLLSGGLVVSRRFGYLASAPMTRISSSMNWTQATADIELSLRLHYDFLFEMDSVKHA